MPFLLAALWFIKIMVKHLQAKMSLQNSSLSLSSQQGHLSSCSYPRSQTQLAAKGTRSQLVRLPGWCVDEDTWIKVLLYPPVDAIL